MTDRERVKVERALSLMTPQAKDERPPLIFRVSEARVLLEELLIADTKRREA